MSEELIAFCRGKISGYRIPRMIEMLKEPLPKSGAGKIAKRLLREPYWKGAGRTI
jgi:long-chain acyl-CoA synthetase